MGESNYFAVVRSNGLKKRDRMGKGLASKGPKATVPVAAEKENRKRWHGGTGPYPTF